jgi:tetratricopeptide (TPR) repeat protein
MAEEPPLTATPAPDQLTPLPEGSPSNPDAAALVDAARRLLRDRDPQKALSLLESAAEIEPEHTGLLRLLTVTRVEARRAQIEALTTAALEHFVRNEHRKAQDAVEKALALDPKNRKALELRTILGALG